MSVLSTRTSPHRTVDSRSMVENVGLVELADVAPSTSYDEELDLGCVNEAPVAIAAVVPPDVGTVHSEVRAMVQRAIDRGLDREVADELCVQLLQLDLWRMELGADPRAIGRAHV